VTSPSIPAADRACPACGAGTPARARFCPSCGRVLGPEGVERRVVTVLFADVVGSTALVEALDPEAARGLLERAFRQLAGQIHRFGGTVEKFVGDAILAVFGYPAAHGDDAERAVRAALALRGALPPAETAIGDVQLRLRIGLETGEVVAGCWAGDLRLSGDTVHTAARIQQGAEPDQILASTRTLRAVRGAVHTGTPWPLLARGKQRPVEVVEVLGLGQVEPAPAPIVDREQELPALVRTLTEAQQRGGLVLLIGEAGIGKSTLARAAVRQLDRGTRVLWGRCLPDWQSVPLWPLREVLAAAAGVPAAESPALLGAAMRRLVEAVWPDPGTVAPASTAVRRLLGLDAVEQDPAGEAGARELAAALRGVLCGLARERRVLVVLEDLHWATADLLDLVTLVVGEEGQGPARPAVLGITRPELLGEHPAWAAAVDACRVQLGSLGEVPTANLLASVLGRDAPGELLGRVYEASHGNPLFVQELALALRDADPAALGGASLPIPDSLQALIAARLDRLPTSSKRLLCQASVVGKAFSSAALAGMALVDPVGVEGELKRVLDSGLIESVAGQPPGGGRRYTFHHALFRDVAYSVLPKANRSELHRRLADWLASGPQREVAIPQVVAHHLVQAVRLAQDVGALTERERLLATRAVVYCRRAAERLRDQEALVAGARILDDAVAMAAVARMPQEDVTELLALRGTLRGATGDADGALDDLRAASHSKRAAIRALAFTELSNLQAQLGRYREAATAADRAVVEAQAARSPSLAAQALRAKGYEPYLAGRLVETERLLEDAVERARSDTGRQGLTVELTSTLLAVRLALATPLPTLAAEAQALAGRARAAGRRLAEASAHYILGEVALLRDELDAAEAHFGAAYQQRREVGWSYRRLMWPLIGLTWTAIERGEPQAARRLAEETVRITTPPRHAPDPEAEANLALACAHAGDLDAATAAIQRAWARLHDTDVMGKARILRTEGRLADARGDHGGAVELLERSLACLDASDYRLDRLRADVLLAGCLRRAGRGADADALAAVAGRQAAAIGARALLRALETSAR
jgi:class 3 adenylate cyclase/tetratricopeptide (TPR) repeat protein